MKHQQVSVDYWSMGKAMATYAALTVLVWIMLRLFNTAFTLPRRLRAQQTNMENTLKELQKRYPEMNITEEDLQNAEKELEDFVNQDEAIEDEAKDETIQDETKDLDSPGTSGSQQGNSVEKESKKSI